MVNYVRLAATAKRLIDKNGRTLTFRKRSSTPKDPAKPWRGNVETPAAELTPKGVVLPISGTDFGDSVFTDFELFKTYTKFAMIAANSVATGNDLQTFSTVEDGGRAYTIGEVAELKPGPVPLVYFVGLSA